VRGADMKRILAIFFATLFSLGLIAQNAMAIKPSGEEMVTGVFVGSEPVTPAPLTAKEVKDINRDLLKEKDKKTAKAIGGLAGKGGAIEKLGEKIVGLNNKVGAIDNVSKTLNRVGAAMNRNTFVLAGLVVAGIVILGLLMLYIGRSIHNLGITVDRVEDKIDKTPEDTAKLVKQLEPITIVVKVARREITYIPEIVDNMYLTLYVPKSADNNVPDGEIARIRKRDPGDVHNSTRDVMKMYYSSECPSLQKRVIDRLEGTMTLQIKEEITA
jgi:hypothetical protein